MRINKHRMAINTRYETPYYIIKGSSPGKTVMITAGVHGKEIASILAAKRLVNLLKKNKFQIENGTLIIVPIANIRAYKRRIRGVPDLNRTFPKKWNDKATHPLSAAIFRITKEYKPSWYIDLHEANGLSKINPSVLGQTLIVNPRSAAIRSIKQIIARLNRSINQKSKHFTLRVRNLSGSGRDSAFHLLKANAVTVETCWSLSISARVNFQLKILERLLTKAKLIKRGSSILLPQKMIKGA